MSMINVKIDGKECQAPAGWTILQIARENGVNIPTLCHDERVKPYGSCGLCVVEVEGNRNLVRSCSIEAAEGMNISSRTERVLRSRKLTLEMLLSDHCGDCRPPCLKACPAQTDCQGYVGLIANGQYREAVALLKERFPLPASIGLVCPHPCEDACRRQMIEEPVSIAALKAFVAYEDLNSENCYMPDIKPSSGKKVAVVGSGPAGLTAAFFLAREGHQVKVFEAMPQAGGMLRYGIPQYRLPKELLEQEISLIARMGVEFVYNSRIGREIELDKLRAEFDAVFLGIGAWTSSRIGCTGEDTRGVLGGIDFLRDVALKNPVILGARVAVIGGGNTAMDAARTAVRLGAREVMVLYRRTRAEMPAEEIEIKEAEEEGVVFKFLVAPEEIISDEGRVAAIRLQKMQLGEADASGRRRPVPIPGEEEIIPLDTIIAAIGQQVNPAGFEDVRLNRWGAIDADEISFMTSMEGVFAGGDGVSGPGIAIEAIAQGRSAADAMIKYLRGEACEYRPRYLAEKQVTAEEFTGMEKQPRVQQRHVDAEKRCRNFDLVTYRFSADEAIKEARRCLECGCADYFECKLIKYAGEYEVQPQRLSGDKHEVPPVEAHPFINRDMNKCILCGLCIRICDEVMGAAALGLVHRGFDTVIEPELGVNLKETDCICCGQCAAVCPTGALTEQNSIYKNVPLELTATPSCCSGCSLACRQVVKSRGDMVVKVEPEEGELLCSRGRFGWQALEEGRIYEPLIKKDGALQPSSFDEALRLIASSVAAIRDKYGSSSLAICTSPASTMEEAGAEASLAREVLGTNKLGSFSYNPVEGLANIKGDTTLATGMENLPENDVILMLGSFANSQVAAVKARQAALNGSQLLIISPEDTPADDLAEIKIVLCNNSVQLLKELLAAVKDKKAVAENEVWDEALRKDIVRMADLYSNAGKVMLMIDGYSVSSAAMEIIPQLATARPGTGLLLAGPGANAWGMQQAGFTAGGEQVLEEIDGGKIKALMIIGEDPAGAGMASEAVLAKTEFLVVLTPFMTPTAAMADVVIPISTPLETDGTYMGMDGGETSLRAAKRGLNGGSNLEVINQLAAAIPWFAGNQPGESTGNGIQQDNIKAGSQVLFQEIKLVDFAARQFEERMRSEGLK
ncbi:MAG: NAD(P)-binding protein [Syntrophomonas sp.]